jgi:hypothetical protein
MAFESDRPAWLTTALLTIGAVIVALVVVAFIPERVYRPRLGRMPPAVTMLLQVKLFVTTANLVLILALTGTYAQLYRDLPNKYTRSLLLLSFALVFYAFTSSPLVQLLLGLRPRPRPEVGVFGFLPDLFVGVAVVVLLYQSRT